MQRCIHGGDTFKYVDNNGNVAVNNKYQTGEIEQSSGKYNFLEYVPGNYIIRFIYGDNESIVTTLSALQRSTYTGHDFKSTVFQIGFDALDSLGNLKDPYYNLDDNTNNGLNDKRVSDAKDNWERRQKVIEYSKEIINHNANVLDAGYRGYQNLLSELMENTWMYADTAKFNVEVEYLTGREVAKGSENTNVRELDWETSKKSDYTHPYITYDVRNVDFGIEEKPIAELTLTKDVSRVLLVLSDGTVVLDIDKEGLGTYNVSKIPYIINLDEELMHGATIKIEYTITVQNTGEVDYYGKDIYYNHANGSALYHKVRKIVDYYDPDLIFNENDVTNAEYGWRVANNSEDLGDLSSTVSGAIEVGSSALVTEKLKDIGLKASINGKGESESVKLTLSRTITSTNKQDELSYDNIAEISKYNDENTGRRTYDNIPGNLYPDPNQDLNPSEADSDKAVTVKILPPLGDKAIYYTLGIVILVIVIVGIIIIKKKVIDK